MAADCVISIRLDVRDLASLIQAAHKLHLPLPRSRGGALRLLLEHIVSQLTYEGVIVRFTDTKQANEFLEGFFGDAAVQRTSAPIDGSLHLGVSARREAAQQPAPQALAPLPIDPEILAIANDESIDENEVERRIAAIRSKRDAEFAASERAALAEQRAALSCAPTGAPMVHPPTGRETPKE